MTDIKHIVVIGPGTSVAEVDCFNNIVSMSPLPCTYHLRALFGAKSLMQEDPELISSIIVLGGSGSLTEVSAWRTQLESWFSKCLQKNIPTLGICWGHQWIANFFGGEVKKIPGLNGTKYIGSREIEVQANKLYSETRTGRVIVSHGSMVTKAPKDTNILVMSDILINEVFEYQNHPIYSFQSHPEATLAFMQITRYQCQVMKISSLAMGSLMTF
jgi:GMP synthase (glutamine-hydrolysing)